jgi:hypothetical protein
MWYHIRATVFVAALILTGCDAFSPPPPPQYTDAFDGLLKQNSTTVPMDRPVVVQQPLGVTFSNNVEAYLQYTEVLRGRVQGYGNIRAVKDLDPNFLASRVAALLKAKYANVEIIDDFNEGLRKGIKSFALIDTQPQIGWFSGQTTTMDISVYFLDGAAQPLSHISGRGSAALPYPNTCDCTERATAAAMGRYKRNSTRLRAKRRW